MDACLQCRDREWDRVEVDGTVMSKVRNLWQTERKPL